MFMSSVCEGCDAQNKFIKQSYAFSWEQHKWKKSNCGVQTFWLGFEIELKVMIILSEIFRKIITNKVEHSSCDEKLFYKPLWYLWDDLVENKLICRVQPIQPITDRVTA